MRMVEVEFEGLELYVRFDRLDDCPTGIFAMRGRDNMGQYRYHKLECFSEKATEEIEALGRARLAQELQDEAEEAKYIKETCYDTPYA